MLQALFADDVLSVTSLDPGYSGHASDVWLVRTRGEEAVVRASRLAGEPANDFWWGLGQLFGIDPRRVSDMAVVNGYLAEVSDIPVPRVIRQGVVDGRPHVVVERMAGHAARSFADLPAGALAQLGRSLGRIHARRFAELGAPSGQVRYAPEAFHPRMAQVMRDLVERFHPALAEPLEQYCRDALALPAPEAGALIMIDFDATQFLSDGERFTALVDTEAYVLGPRELDFVALEYVLDEQGAAAVARGYRSVQPLPDLRRVRPVYRYLSRLLAVQGRLELGRWMAWPAWFDLV